MARPLDLCTSLPKSRGSLAVRELGAAGSDYSLVYKVSVRFLSDSIGLDRIFAGGDTSPCLSLIHRPVDYSRPQGDGNKVERSQNLRLKLSTNIHH